MYCSTWPCDRQTGDISLLSTPNRAILSAAGGEALPTAQRSPNGLDMLSLERSDVSGEVTQPGWAEGLANRIEELGVSAIALALIEVIRPFGPLVGLALLGAQPLLSGAASKATREHAVALLDGTDLIDGLQAQLEKQETRHENSG